MEARTGNGTQAKAVAPRDRKLPLKSVRFIRPVAVAGFAHPLSKFERGEAPDRECPDKACPGLFVDPELDAIVIGEEHFPMHLVSCYVRAKSA